MPNFYKAAGSALDVIWQIQLLYCPPAIRDFCCLRGVSA
jgi:hypothetical protein